MARREVDDQDALDSADEGARMLAEGRYAAVQGDRPGMVERAAGFVRARKRWQAHLHGWACVRCGPTAHSRLAAHRHDWWHRWLEAMFTRIGEDVDKLEGEARELRAELAAVERSAALAMEQARTLTELFGPVLASLYGEQEARR